MPGVLLFTLLTLVATLIHPDLFHKGSFFGWAWLVVYIVVPPAIIVCLVGQLRTEGADPPRRAPLPGWLRAVLGVQAAVMLAFGMGLSLAPNVISAQMVRENDFVRDYAAIIGYAVSEHCN